MLRNGNWLFVRLNHGSTLTAASAGGDKGNIFLNSQVIELQRGSSISTNALGNATGGNSSINTDFIVVGKNESSDITANAVNNFGEHVVVQAPFQSGAGSWDKPVECRQFTSTATDSNSLIPSPQVLSVESVK